MITFYIGAFLFWLVAIGMIFWDVSKIANDISFNYRNKLSKRIYVFLCMIIAMTYILARMYPSFQIAIILKDW